MASKAEKTIPMSGNEKFFVIRLKGQKNRFLRDVDWVGLRFDEAYLYNGFWTLINEAVCDYENEKDKVLRFNTEEEAKVELLNIVKNLSAKFPKELPNEVFEIVCVEATFKAKAVKEYTKDTINKIADELTAKLDLFEDWFLETNLAKETNIKKEDLAPQRKKELDGYTNEQLEKYYNVWLELNP